jgi:D-threo-aldose 1-dehydrogenase
MRRIAMPGIGFDIPVIGFGCSSLASVGEKKAQELLGAAFDAGVRHFDVARYYGYGEAEGMLGNFVKSRRADVTITTKVGIEPPRRTSGLRLAMQAGRRLVRLVPAARGFLKRRAQRLVTGGKFSVQEAQTSLETSLRELGVDYVDFLLLHEYTVSENSPDELVAFLTDAVKAGKIRYFGLGTDIENTLRALESQPELCAVAQFENSVLRRNLKRLAQGGPLRLAITHGALGTSFQAVSAFLKSNPEVKQNWSEKLALDCARDEIISALMLNYSAQANADGLVLFSSKHAARVKSNVKAVLEPEFSPVQVELFGQFVKRDMMAANSGA